MLETVPADIEARVASLISSFYAKADAQPDRRCYVLVDPSLRDAALAWLDIDPALGQKAIPFAIAEELFPSEQRPCLYPLDLESQSGGVLLESSLRLALEDWQPEVAAQGQGHRIGAWLWADKDVPAATLAQHLARQSVHFDTALRAPVLLRFFDPRNTAAFWDNLNADQQATWLGPIQTWDFIDYYGEQRSLVAQSQANPAQKLMLTGRQWESVDQWAYVNQALAQWQAEANQAIIPPLRQIAQQAAATGLSYGLKAEGDIVLFTRLSLSLPERFETHPVFRPVWEAVRDGQPLPVALNQLDAHAWRQINPNHNE